MKNCKGIVYTCRLECPGECKHQIHTPNNPTMCSTLAIACSYRWIATPKRKPEPVTGC